MSCSLQSATKYLIDKNLVKPSMELYSPTPTKRLSDTIARLTSIARTKYGVDMGDLFRARFRDIDVGNYLTMGSASTVTRVRLEPNTPAFEAIDRAQAQEDFRQQRELDIRRFALPDVQVEAEQIQQEGNFIVNDDRTVYFPKSLPEINVRC